MGEPDAPAGSTAVVRGYIDGCFDIMHSGHYNALRQAKKICDVLVVGVHSDEEIKRNKAMPVMWEVERYALLGHIKWIDELVYDVPYSPQIATLERARADFCVHGDDMPVNADGVCAYDEMKQCGRLRIIKRTEGVSTTDLIGRLLTLSRHQHQVADTSAPLGRRLSSDDAIEELEVLEAVTEPEAASDCGQGAAEAALHTIDELGAKYGMSGGDLQRLKDSVGSRPGLGAPAPDPRGAAPAAEGTGGSAEKTRSSAPVQLLASTRRITEFASSRQPGDGDRVVYVCGSFDMFHVGHARFLQEARALGTFLLVGIHDDIAVSRSKGVSLPIMSLNERVLNVCACKWVDEALIGAPHDVSEDLLNTWSIHVVARGAGHMRSGVASEQAPDRYAIPRRLGIYAEVLSRWPQLCHETIVQRIISSREAYLRRNMVRAQREDEYYSSKGRSEPRAEE